MNAALCRILFTVPTQTNILQTELKTYPIDMLTPKHLNKGLNNIIATQKNQQQLISTITHQIHIIHTKQNHFQINRKAWNSTS